MSSDQTLSDLLKLSARTSTFVSIDVLGSTALKAGEVEQDIVYHVALTYHKTGDGFVLHPSWRSDSHFR